MIDIEEKIKEIQLSWEPKICYSDGNWTHIPKYYLGNNLLEVFHQQTFNVTPSCFCNTTCKVWS